ncbi:MAG: FecR domain-containing protein [Proteobacteria bacterium]|nr:FecR domain-containing protein [Pseudomonadota bacterium]
MNARDKQVRTAIAEQASEWFVRNDETPLGTEESGALVDWLKASPMHVEEFLSVAAIARDLHAVGTNADYSMDALIARARTDSDDDRVRWFGSKEAGTVQTRRHFHWYALAAGVVVAAAFLGSMLWDRTSGNRMREPNVPTALHLETRHGEQRSFRLPDNTVVHLNTQTALTVQYSRAERLVVLTSGEAAFDVVHEPKRAFRVSAGPAEIVDLGTRFAVRLKPEATVVTVVSGRIAVKPPPGHHSSQPIELGANQQVSVAEGRWPIALTHIDASRTTAWMHRQIVFDHEPLERVAAEFNRYAAKPVEITAPELRGLEVSGVFSTDNPDEFLAFLRSLEGVRVEVTATRIRVTQK